MGPESDTENCCSPRAWLSGSDSVMVGRSPAVDRKALTVSKRSGTGRHCRRRRPVSLPSVVGSVAVIDAASGTLTMPSAGASNGVFFSSDALQRPEATDRAASGLDTIVAAGQSLKEESAERAEAAHEAAVEQARKEAAERKAREEREARRWVSPLSRYRISATFGSTGQLWSGTHTGVDLAASYGTEVKSLSSGEIIWSGWDGAYGNKIVVRHWDGTETWYCHLSRFIQRSGSVAPGDVIGAVGSTGNSTGPHLHLEVHPDGGSAVNPLWWLSERGLSL